MRLEIELNGKKSRTDLPTNWDQVTFKQFLELVNIGTDYVKAITIFTGVDAEIIRKAKISGLYDVLAVLNFLRTEPPSKVPERILFYKLPKDLGFETIAQYEDTKRAISEKSKSKTSTTQHQRKSLEELKIYPMLCAIYACKFLSSERCAELKEKYPTEDLSYGTYHYLKAEAMRDEFLNCPAPEVLGIGNFTLLKLTALNLNINPNFQKPLSQTKKWKLAIKRWALRLGVLEPFYRWQRKRVINSLKSTNGAPMISTTWSDILHGWRTRIRNISK